MFNSILQALPEMSKGLLLTLQLTLSGVLGGLVLGTILALMRMSSNKVLSISAGGYVFYCRSIPLLLVIYWFYFGFPMLVQAIYGSFVVVGAFYSCLIAFAMFEAAYFCEIVRAGIQAVSKGQMDAASALGMSYGQSMRLIILPQVFRKMAPLLLQQSIILFQDTTLVYAVGLMDFFGVALSRGQVTGELNLFVLVGGAVYFIFGFIASYFVKRLKRKLTV